MARRIIIGVLIAIAGIIRGYNMFGYPAYREDEGTYVSQSWSFLRHGQLAPYTYWYDHAPAGWMFMSLWNALAGFVNFGPSVNTGRIFMLIIHLATAWLIYQIVIKSTRSFLAALLSVVAFSVTPLGISSQRRVLLDNIMNFWLLVSINLLISRPSNLIRIIFSGLTFAIAVLSKETAIILLPVFTLASFFYPSDVHKRFSLGLWLSISLLTISLYPLLAIYKQELFPQGSFLAGNHPHVSLWEAVSFQSGRSGGFFLNPQSDFQTALRQSWLPADVYFLIIGLVSVVFNLIFWSKTSNALLLSFSAVVYILYLIRGGVVLDWYIVFLIPAFAINIGLFFANYQSWLRQGRLKWPVELLLLILILAPMVHRLISSRELFIADETTNQILAIDWIKQNIPSSALIVIDNYAYVDFHENSSHPLAHYYWKVEQDPAIRQDVIKDNWQNVDYVLYTRAIQETLQQQNMPFVQTIVNNSFPLITFNQSRFVFREPYIVEILETNSQRKYLRFGWQWYKNNFITSSGQVIDPSSQNTTSEGQSYALLRAVWMDDPSTFDLVWRWTQEYLQGSNGTVLFSWLVQNQNGRPVVQDDTSAADADIDIALALLFAAKKWDNQNYLHQAEKIITAIWQHETVSVGEHRLLLAGNWSGNDLIYSFNPSYFSPSAFRIFAQVQPQQDWIQLIDSSYYYLDLCRLDQAQGLLPDWCFVDHQGQLVSPVTQDQLSDRQSGYDAQRIPWRLALDYYWYNDRRSLDQLIKTNFFRQAWRQQQIIHSAYNDSGQPLTNQEALSQYASLLGYFQLLDPPLGQQIYQQKIRPAMTLNKQGVYWGDPQNYYDQNWVWFGLALEQGILENIWLDDRSPK